MSKPRPFSKKPTAAQPAQSTVPLSTIKHFKTYCNSSEYYKSRGSAQLFADFSHLDDLPLPFQPSSAIKPNMNKKRSKRRTIKEFRAHTRHNSRENHSLFSGTASASKSKKAVTQESMNASHHMKDSSIIGVRSRTVMCQPLSSLLTSVNFKLSDAHSRELVSEKLMRHNNIITLTILEDIETLEGNLQRLQTENKKMQTLNSLRQLYLEQRQRLQELSSMQQAMQTADTAKPSASH